MNMFVFVRRMAALLFGVMVFTVASAQGPAPEGQDDIGKKIAALNWQHGPVKGRLGANSSIDLPAGYMILDNADTQKFMEYTENFGNDREFLAAPEDLSWFAVFSFEDTGYVKDDETIDPDPILQSAKEGTQQGNEERRQRGWDELTVLGWRFQPQYDRQARLLEWAMRLKSGGSADELVNYETRILGRSGVTSVVLVADSAGLDPAVADLKRVLTGFSYDPGAALHGVPCWRPCGGVWSRGTHRWRRGGCGNQEGFLGGSGGVLRQDLEVGDCGGIGHRRCH